jgi:hypothetical protein
MTRILLVCGMVPALPVLEEALPALAAAGVSVNVCVRNPDHLTQFAGLPTEQLHILSRQPWRSRSESRWSPFRIALGLGWRAYRLRMRQAGPPLRLWLLASRDPWFRQTVQDSQVVVAMDRIGVYTVWRANRLKGDRRAFYGLPATLRHLSVSPSASVSPASAPHSETSVPHSEKRKEPQR